MHNSQCESYDTTLRWLLSSDPRKTRSQPNERLVSRQSEWHHVEHLAKWNKLSVSGIQVGNGAGWRWSLCRIMEDKGRYIETLSWNLQNEAILSSRVSGTLNFCFGKLTSVAEWRQGWKKAILKAGKPLRKLLQLSRWKMIMAWTRVLTSLRPSAVPRT